MVRVPSERHHQEDQKGNHRQQKNKKHEKTRLLASVQKRTSMPFHRTAATSYCGFSGSFFPSRIPKLSQLCSTSSTRRSHEDVLFRRQSASPGIHPGLCRSGRRVHRHVRCTCSERRPNDETSGQLVSFISHVRMENLHGLRQLAVATPLLTKHSCGQGIPNILDPDSTREQPRS